jgi:hypothetical protein
MRQLQMALVHSGVDPQLRNETFVENNLQIVKTTIPGSPKCPATFGLKQYPSSGFLLLQI